MQSEVHIKNPYGIIMLHMHGDRDVLTKLFNTIDLSL